MSLMSLPPNVLKLSICLSFSKTHIEVQLNLAIKIRIWLSFILDSYISLTLKIDFAIEFIL